MKGFMGLTKRNLLIFFKDRQSVIFSLLTSIIVLVLYLLFLKGTFVNSINSAAEALGELKPLVKNSDIEMYANMTLLVGVLGSALITVPFNCLNTVVRDRENKVDMDILATPIKRWQIILSYFLSAVIASVLMTAIILTAGLLILGANGNMHLTIASVCGVYLVTALGAISATAFFMILVLLFKSSQASGAFFGMLSAAAGFVIGAYIPISQFSDSVQTVCNIFPASQITILLRNMLLNDTLTSINNSLEGLDEGMFVETVKQIFTFKAKLFNADLDVSQMVIYIVIGTMVCIVAQVILFSKTYRKK